MKKKLAAIIIFISVLVVPMVFWPLFDYVDKTEIEENRELAAYPDKFDNQYFVNFDKYFLDHLPLRKPAIKAYTAVEKAFAQAYDKLLGDLGLEHFAVQNNVVFGKDDWLFYTGDNSLDYYRGTNLPTADEMQAYAARAAAVNDYFKSLGKTFVIMIIPNKEQMYAEYMPDGIKVHSQKKRMDVIYDYFTEKNDVTLVYPKRELMDGKADYQVYYKQDTHWNNVGAYIGAMALLDALNFGKGDVAISPSQRDSADLANMIAQEPITDVDYKCDYRAEITLKVTVEENGDTRRCVSNSLNGKKAVLLGDSFRTAMIDSLGKEFGESVFSHRRQFTAENNYFRAEIAEADVVVFQAVERYEYQIFADGGLLDVFINEFISQGNKTVTE